MKIHINDDGKDFNIILPSGIFMNRACVAIIQKKLKKKGLDLPPDLLYELIKTIKQYKKDHEEWSLVEVSSADGAEIEIRI